MNWFRRRHPTARALPRGVSGSMREFVYLDEIAVTSLVSSLLGSVAEGSTESLTREFLAEVSTSQDARVPGFYQGSVGGKVGGKSGSSLSTQRKANIQASFGELEVALKERYVLKVPESLPRNFEASPKSLDRALDARHAVNVRDLARGKPFTLNVELELDESYSILALVETFSEFAKESELIGHAAAEALSPAQAVGRILRMMMGGLVPLVCPTPGLRAVTRDSEEYVMPADLAEMLGGEWHVAELRVVAICEEAAFWKDIRRVGFERGEYRVTGRVARDSLQSSWSPIKMSDVVRRYFPEVATQLDALPAIMSESMRSAKSVPTPSGAITAALLDFSLRLAHSHKRELDPDTMSRLLEVPEAGASYETPDEWRPAFDRAASILGDDWGLQFTSEELLEARAMMLNPRIQPPPQVPASPPPREVRYLEADVIAIHW